MKLKKFNRINRQYAHKSKWWCGSCDRALVGRVGRCPVCNAIEDKKRKK